MQILKGLLFFVVASFSLQAWTAPIATATSVTPVLERIATAWFDDDLKYKGTRVGGLSGLVFDPESSTWFAVCDDRGRKQEPRIYKLDFQISKTSAGWKLEPKLLDVLFVHAKGEKRWKKEVLDLEGIALLPWGNLLVASEGDNNKKPRSLPTLLDIKTDGTWARNFEFPDEFLPESAGAQTKGIRNNMGPEGLTGNGAGKFWVAMEGPLIQDKAQRPGQVRIIQYDMPEAWVLKPAGQFFYTLENPSNDSIAGEHGVSALFWLKAHELIVMERGLELSTQGLNFEVELFHVTLGEPGSVLKKKRIVDFTKLEGRTTNFEALAVGPLLPDGRKTLIAMSDNNFQKNEKTQFWLFALGTEKK